MPRLVLVLYVLFIGCGGPEEVCTFLIAPMTGKVVSTHAPCAGIVVQQLNVSTTTTPTSYTDNEGNTYENVFVVANMCEMLDEDVEWLSDPDHIGVGFIYSFIGPIGNDPCEHCEPAVTLPNRSEKIVLTRGPCNRTY